MRLVEAVYEKGLLKPMKPLKLRPGECVGLIIVRRPNPSRWNLDGIANTVDVEDKQLTEQGLEDWSVNLESEDQ